jgi:lysophospholipase L1-like esterase
VTNPAAAEMLTHLADGGVETVMDRFKSQTPQCGFGLRGTCCRMCQWGPCRISARSPRGVCGRSIELIAMANLLLLAALSTGLGLLVTEAVLRLTGYRWQTFPTVQFGWPQPEVIANEYQPDRELFWVTRDYWKVLGESRRIPPDVVFEGDSCTQFSDFPRYAIDLLAASRPDLARGVKVGVGGWSSRQGLQQLRRDVLPLHPRVVTVYFGWNDHWMALGPVDAEATPGPLTWWLTQHLRIAQLVAAAALRLETSAVASRPNRVPLADYGANLRAMADLARHAGVILVFITAPSNHVRGAEPAYLAERHLRSLADLVPLHRAYEDATREAARRSGSALCDAAQAFDQLDAGARRAAFRRDGIHLTDEGDRRLASIVAGCLARAVPVLASTAKQK